MSFGTALMHLCLLITMAFIAVSLGMLAWTTSPELEVPPEAGRRVWALLPLVPALWIALSIINRASPIGTDVIFAASVWGVAWWFARGRIMGSNSAAVILALLFLTSIHLGLMFDLSRSTTAMRGLWTSALPWTAVGLFLMWNRHSAETSKTCSPSGASYAIDNLIEGNTGVRNAIGLIAVAILMVVIQTFAHHYMPIYAAASLGFLVVVASIAGRQAMKKARPPQILTLKKADRDFKGWWEWHWPLLSIVGLTVVAPLAIKDFSPIILISLTFALILAVMMEWRNACLLVFLMVLGLVTVYVTGVVPRLENRITIMRSPSAGSNSQLMGDLWSIARPGLLGAGPGRLFLIKAGKESQRPATILADTDAVFIALAESSGVIGVSSTLIALGVIVAWFFKRGANARTTTNKIWFIGSGSLLGLTALWTAAWVVDLVPMAGLACPLLAAGYGVTLLWSSVLLFSIDLAEQEDRAGSYAPLVVTNRLFSASAVRSIHIAIGISGLITLTAYMSLSTWRREDILTTPFENREEENRVRDGIETGLFRVDAARVVSVDFTKRLPLAHQFRKAEDEYRWALHAVKRHEVELAASSVEGVPRLRPAPSRAFNEGEPSGLGTILIDCRESNK